MARFAEGVDTLFHLAALIAIPSSYVAPRSYLETNAAGTLNVLEAVRRAGVRRMVHTSTSEVYGTAQRVPIDEAHPLQGQSRTRPRRSRRTRWSRPTCGRSTCRR